MRRRLQNGLRKLILFFIYGIIFFTIYMSFPDSRLLPSYGLVGWENYSKLLRLSHWKTAITNLAVFAALYSVIGLLLATLLDQKIRGAGMLRPICLYLVALSFIVTGMAWKWMLDPSIGIEHTQIWWAGKALPLTGSRSAITRSIRMFWSRSGKARA